MKPAFDEPSPMFVVLDKNHAWGAYLADRVVCSPGGNVFAGELIIRNGRLMPGEQAKPRRTQANVFNNPVIIANDNSLANFSAEYQHDVSSLKSDLEKASPLSCKTPPETLGLSKEDLTRGKRQAKLDSF